MSENEERERERERRRGVSSQKTEKFSKCDLFKVLFFFPPVRWGPRSFFSVTIQPFTQFFEKGGGMVYPRYIPT